MAYASTVSLDIDHAERISQNLGILTGSIDVTSAHSSPSSETDISDKFSQLLTVSLTSSEKGYVGKVDVSDCKFYFYEAGADGDALDAVADDTDVGTFEFIAIGLL